MDRQPGGTRVAVTGGDDGPAACAEMIARSNDGLRTPVLRRTAGSSPRARVPRTSACTPEVDHIAAAVPALLR